MAISNALIDELVRQSGIPGQSILDIKITPKFVYFTVVHELTDSVKVSIPVCNCQKEEPKENERHISLVTED